jgi:hypothetical protein
VIVTISEPEPEFEAYSFLFSSIQEKGQSLTVLISLIGQQFKQKLS